LLGQVRNAPFVDLIPADLLHLPRDALELLKGRAELPH
jgi:hypothetical protein